LHAPELMPIEDLHWRFEDGHIPVLHSEWRAGKFAVKSSLHSSNGILPLSTAGCRCYLTLRITNDSPTPLSAHAYLVIRSFGAAGGPISWLGEDPATGAILVNKRVAVIPEIPGRFGAWDYEEKCITPCSEIHDPSTWASGAIEYEFTLAPGESVAYDFAFLIHAGHWALGDQTLPRRPLEVAQKRDAFIGAWRDDLRIGLDLPDKRFSEAMHAQIAHLRQFMVYDSPRISPVSYPLFWLRDASYIVVALDKAGYHDEAARAIRSVKERVSFGGFGAEADGPSMMIWMIHEHYRLTYDSAFLEEMWPTVQRLATLIIEMRNTDKTLRSYPEILIPKMQFDPSADILCFPARDGLIQGRMDHHVPLVWVNAFACAALKSAAIIAAELGHDSMPFTHEFALLLIALEAKLPDIYGQNERDFNVLYWPSGLASHSNAATLPTPNLQHETLWTYFEAGQAHNQLLAGHPERAWFAIEHFLSKHAAQGLYTYHEGNCDENSSGLWQHVRGWDKIKWVTPHGWTAAELFLLLRDCLVHEKDDGIVIGAGIPASWLEHDFSVSNLPTKLGPVSFTHRAGKGYQCNANIKIIQ